MDLYVYGRNCVYLSVYTGSWHADVRTNHGKSNKLMKCEEEMLMPATERKKTIAFDVLMYHRWTDFARII